MYENAGKFPPDIQGIANTPVTNFLFITNLESKKLRKEQRQIIPPTSSQTTIFKQTYKTRQINSSCILMHKSKRDYKKLTRVIQYKISKD